MKTADEGSTDAAGTPAKAVPTRTTPLFKLKRPVTREDVPQLMSAANLFKGALKGELSERQQQCLAKDPSVGSLYKTAMMNDHGRTLRKQLVLTDVTANPAHDGGYSFIPDISSKFFDKRNFTTIMKCVDDRKSQPRKEKQAKHQTGVPAKARGNPPGYRPCAMSRSEAPVR